REDVRLEGALELLRADPIDGLLRVLFARIVDEHIETAELSNCLLDGLPADRRVANVAAEEKKARPMLLDQLPRLLGVAVLVEVDPGHVRSLLREGNRHRAADAAIAAGDQGNAPMELVAARLGVVLCLRSWPHLAFETGLPVLGLRRPERPTLLGLA